MVMWHSSLAALARITLGLYIALQNLPHVPDAAAQAAVAVGELGIQLGDPDGYALDVLGDILNSFGGRLFDRIRSREVRALHAVPTPLT